MISIIIPVYNQADKIIKTLKSLERQTYRDFEVIIVNDGSKDEVEKIVADYLRDLKTDRHYIFLNQENKGAPAARNRGVREARGDYLFFCDADAVLEEEAFLRLLNALEANPGVSYAYSSFRWGRKLFKGYDFDAERLKRQPCIHTMALIRRSDYPPTGWDESIKKLQDWDLWLSFLELGRVGIFVPEVLFTVAPGGNISSWLPAFAYRLLPFLPAVRKYNRAVAVVKKKYGLD